MRAELADVKIRKNMRYDEKRVREYIRYNISKINDCLKESLVRSPENPHLSSIALADKTLDSLQIYIVRVAHLMVGIRKNEERLSRPAPQGLTEILALEVMVAKLMIGENLAKMAYLVLAKRKHSVFLSAENLIGAIESLPRKDFYLTFNGSTYKKFASRR